MSSISFTDHDRDELTIISKDDSDPALIRVTRDGFFLPPHKVPAVCRALYEAAGLPVPDLPDIPDPELVQALAGDLTDTPGSKPYTPSTLAYREAVARELLAKGWGRTA